MYESILQKIKRLWGVLITSPEAETVRAELRKADPVAVIACVVGALVLFIALPRFTIAVTIIAALACLIARRIIKWAKGE